LEAVQRAAAVVALGVFPIAAVIAMIAIGVSTDSLAADFHHELYPEAKLLLRGTDPFPDPGWDPLAGANLIWPPVAGYLVAPLTLVPPAAADLSIVLLGLAALALALWLVDVRDWRVYGAFFLWPEVLGEVRVSHLTPALALLAAIAWRSRETHGVPGTALGVATSLKLLMWPLVVWLAATRRFRDVVVAVTVAAASLLLVLPFTGLGTYARVLARLGRAFDQDSYTVFGMLVQAGAPEAAGRAATVLVGGTLLVGTWRYRSFTLAIAAALALSPIVWLDYFALAAVPLAVHRPRLAWVWFLPLLTWGLEGAGYGIGDAWSAARMLCVFGIVLGVAFAAERTAAAVRPGRTPLPASKLTTRVRPSSTA
jgi:hypothetical protein